ncbi:hypothetical protein SAMN05444420_102185 [Capnocytophaga granulosa]|uniref:Uncharacterized protein n=2 Tax=Capnocytophaga granulosa TaxID=45242 RepID=A0A1H2TFZ2_9FLAO|nr:hypothetical protein HMPREF9331_01240 [Capnocytophaga granulosa ATCC 51502]SDW42841.1 hypothetical protein SAMN05444420_102185 [Capnocytophaga granulosa]SUX15631.1 Uncharacterised protein [Capnocytophaga granulosa]
MKIQQIPLEKQITYMIDLTLKTPHELYINDILAVSRSRGSNAAIDINPYVLKNGKYKIKLRLLPYWHLNETTVSKSDIENARLFFGSYIRNKETDEILNYKADVALPIVAPKEDVPYFEQEWDVELTELPYELEGWSKGQDLRKWDKKELEKKVVAFHQKIRKILNDGNSEEWMKLIQKRFDEVCIFDYLSEKRIEKDLEEIKEDVEEYSKGTMIPLEDYELKLYAEGKLVTLERKTHTREFNNYSPLDIKGWSPLISKGTTYGAAPYPILLYLPQGSDEFVIIRR